MLGSRKGLTPITATIILIAFSFLIGTVVMAWGEKYIEDKADFVQSAAKNKGSCEAGLVRAYEVDSAPQICVKNNVFSAILENGPDSPIEDVQIKIIGTRNVHTKEKILEEPMANSAVKQVSFSFGDIGVPRQVKLTPKVKEGGKILFCDDKSTVIKDFDCSWTQ